MTVSKKVIIFLLLEILIPNTAHYEILDVIFRPVGTKGEVVFPSDDEAFQKGKPNDTMQLSFSAFGEDFDFLLHRSVYPELHRTEVEIHGKYGLNYSDISDIRSIYYEFENYTTSVHGYKNRYGQFQGFVMLRNGRTSYYVEPASVHFPNVPAFASKSIVHKEDEIAIGKSNRRIRSKYRHLINNYAADISKVADAEDFKKHQFTFVFRLELMALASFSKDKGPETAAFMYLHCKESDNRIRRIDFNSTTVRLIPQKLILFNSTSDPGYPFKDEVTSSKDNRVIPRLHKELKENYKLTYDAVIAFTHQYYVGVGSSTDRGMFNHSEGYAIMTIANRKGNRPLNATFKIFNHLIGHLLGSNHDEREVNKEKYEECNPPPNMGVYIMKEDVTSLDLKRFSPCSIENITKYLMYLKNEKIYTRPEPHDECGNGIKGPEEECDCGTPQMCKIVDKCCTPKGGLGTDPECTYRRQRNSLCSAKDDGCCSENCKVMKAGVVCDFSDDGCIVQECDGEIHVCPKLKKTAPIGTKCFAKKGVCSLGSCDKSFCEKSNLITHCSCTGEDACRVCCRDVKNISSCQPAKYLGAFGGGDVFLPRGTKCGRNKICDISGICVAVKTNNTLGIVFGILAALVVLSVVGYIVYRRRGSLMRPKGSSRAPIFRRAKVQRPPGNVRPPVNVRPPGNVRPPVNVRPPANVRPPVNVRPAVRGAF